MMDGKDRPKHVEWYSKLEKQVHLVGFTIEIVTYVYCLRQEYVEYLIEIRVMLFWQGRAFTPLPMIDLYILIICLFLKLRSVYLGNLERYLNYVFTISIESTNFISFFFNTWFCVSWFNVNKGPTRCYSMQTFIHCHVTLHVSGVTHPSSGALKTVSATSGECHGNGISLAFIFLVFPCKMLHKNKIFAIDKILIKYLLLGLYF
jgi:hypothetical protein